MRLIDKRILLREAEAKDQGEYFESLVSSGDKDLKEAKVLVLLHCVNECFKTQNMETVDIIMENIFSLIPDTFAEKSNHIQ